MLRIGLVSVLALACLAVEASAAGYDDFAQGLSANNRGDSALAISSFTSALKAGDLNANLIPVAYYGRAIAYLRGHECALARVDASAALKLKPDYPDALMAQSTAEYCTGDTKSAVVDFSRLVALRPTKDAYRALGYLHWNIGDFGSAAADFSQAAKLTENPVYEVLWHELSLLRAGTFDAKKEKAAIEPLELHDWPAPIFYLFTGLAKPEDIAAAAEVKDPQVAVNQKCEAEFYTAEWWVAQQNADAARPLLEAARTNCPHNFVEYGEAEVELRRLK